MPATFSKLFFQKCQLQSTIHLHETNRYDLPQDACPHCLPWQEAEFGSLEYLFEAHSRPKSHRKWVVDSGATIHCINVESPTGKRFYFPYDREFAISHSANSAQYRGRAAHSISRSIDPDVIHSRLGHVGHLQQSVSILIDGPKSVRQSCEPLLCEIVIRYATPYLNVQELCPM